MTTFRGFRDVTFCGQVFADNSVRRRSIVSNVRSARKSWYTQKGLFVAGINERFVAGH